MGNQARKNLILLPVSFSPTSLDWATRQAQTSFSSDRVSFVHVLAPLPPMNPGVVWNKITDESRARQARIRLQAELAKRGLQEPQIITAVGSPGERISQVAASEGCHLIALSTRGRSGVERWLMGSVAQDVIGKACCPVLVSPYTEVAELVPRAAIQSVSAVDSGSSLAT